MSGQDTDIAVIRISVAAVHLHGQTGKETKQARAVRHDDGPKIAIWHAHVHRFAERKVICSLVGEIGHAKQNFCTFLVMHSAPRSFLKCLRSSLYRSIRVRSRTLGYGGDHSFGCRIAGRHRCAIRSVPPTTVDQQLTRSDGTARRFGLNGIDLMIVSKRRKVWHWASEAPF